MPQYRPEDDERDPEEPEDFDRDDDLDGTDTEPCPFCKRQIHEKTDICPYCGSFILHDLARPPRPGVVWLITAIGLLIMMILAILLYGQWI
ncbi:MAG TPA: hypothetical protein VFE58_07315 [Tepidisphaeraceae bacterium]|jgi:hypothetical protein|nr:hypothetical protein [Tepidisphaeraceae bacterium]